MTYAEFRMHSSVPLPILSPSAPLLILSLLQETTQTHSLYCLPISVLLLWLTRSFFSYNVFVFFIFKSNYNTLIKCTTCINNIYNYYLQTNVAILVFSSISSKNLFNRLLPTLLTLHHHTTLSFPIPLPLRLPSFFFSLLIRLVTLLNECPAKRK